jgi:CRISPR/Cas system CMR-associated protein Cmr5 small subunit
MSKNWFTTRQEFMAGSEKDGINQPHSVGFGVNGKHRFFIEKDLDAADVIKLDPLKLTSSGVSEDDARSFEVSQIVATLKKEPTAIKGLFMARLEKLKSLIFKFGVEKEFTNYSWKKGHIAEVVYLRQQINKETDDAKRGIMESRIQNILANLNVKDEFELEGQIKDFEKIYGEIAVEFNNVVTDAYNAQNMVTRETNEPVPDLYWLILPTSINRIMDLIGHWKHAIHLTSSS